MIASTQREECWLTLQQHTQVFAKTNMNDQSTQIEFRWPWTMIPLECADEWIEFIRAQIGPGHPLYGKTIFPSARREDEDTILVENDDDETYVLLSFDRKMMIRRRRMPFTQVIHSRAELAIILKQCAVPGSDVRDP